MTPVVTQVAVLGLPAAHLGGVYGFAFQPVVAGANSNVEDRTTASSVAAPSNSTSKQDSQGPLSAAGEYQTIGSSPAETFRQDGGNQKHHERRSQSTRDPGHCSDPPAENR